MRDSHRIYILSIVGNVVGVRVDDEHGDDMLLTMELTAVNHDDDDYVSYRVLISLGDFDIRSNSDFNSPTFS